MGWGDKIELLLDERGGIVPVFRGTPIELPLARTVFLNGVPMFVPASDGVVVGDNGRITNMQSHDVAHKALYLYIPAGAIHAGSPAGLYFTILDTITSGTIYNNRYSGGKPSVPHSPVPFVCTGPGSFTQTTNEYIPVLSYTLKGGTMGPNSRLEHSGHLALLAATTTDKFVRLKFGDTILYEQKFENFFSYYCHPYLQNMGVQNIQVGSPTLAGGFGSVATHEIHPQVDTSKDQVFEWSLKITDTADGVELATMLCRLWP